VISLPALTAPHGSFVASLPCSAHPAFTVRSVSKRERRQLGLMAERLELFRAGQIALPRLVGDLEGLVHAHELTDDTWKEDFITYWGTLEIAWAVADDRRQPIPDIKAPDVREAVTELEALVARHPDSN
jgi:hypothetical protein